MRMEQIDGIILDVDGTLWDSTSIVARAWTRAVREEGFTDDTVTAETLKGLFGKTMTVIAQCMYPGETRQKQAAIIRRCCKYEHEALKEDECRICYPGVISGIQELSQKVPVFIVSNCQSGYIELFLEKTGLGPYITDIECFGNTLQPKNVNIRLLADRNHLKYPVYVGDTQGDCEASAGAGVPFIFAEYGFGTVDHCDAKIQSFSQLLNFIR